MPVLSRMSLAFLLTVLVLAAAVSTTPAATPPSGKTVVTPSGKTVVTPAAKDVVTPAAKDVVEPAVKVVAEPAAEVVFDGKSLITIRGRILSFSAAERATTISQRLAAIAEGSLPTSSITETDGEAATIIVADEFVIMSVTDQDAELAETPRRKLAAEYVAILRNAVDDYRAQRSTETLLLHTAYSAAATLLLLLTLWLLRRGFAWLYRRIEAERGRLVRAIRLQKVELLTEQRLAGLLLTTAMIIKFIVYLIVLDLYLTTVLGFFPWTHGFAERLTGYVLAPLRMSGRAFVDFLPNIFTIGAIIFIAFVVLRMVRFLFNEIGKGTLAFPGFHPEWAVPTFNILRFLAIAFVVVIIFPYLPGSASPAFQGISVFLGVLISFGSSSAVSNIVSGIILTYTRAFNLGDRVKIGDTVGDVIEKTLLITRVRTIKNVDITVPNSMILSSHVVNYSTSAQNLGLILHTGVTIGYDAPWRQVHELLKTAAARTTHLLNEPAPFVLQTSLDDFYVSYQINAYTNQANKMAAIYSELHQHIQDCFNEAGVEIMSPHYATLRDGNATAIPASYLPEGYAPQGFRIGSTGEP